MMTRSAKLTLGAMALVCTLPVAASYLSYYVWPPQGQANYGELLAPTPLPSALTEALPQLRGRWTLVYAAPGACDEACRQSLYYMRQVRTAQGEHMERLERLWLLSDGAAPGGALLDAHPGLIVQPLPASADLPALGRILLVDPLGQVMMRFPDPPDPRRMIRDLARLLKYSRLG